jgi:hypothetical protein
MELMGTSFRRCLGGLGLLAGVVMSSAALFLAGLAALAVLAGAVLLSTTGTPAYLSCCRTYWSQPGCMKMLLS